MGDNTVTACQCQERHNASHRRSRMLIISAVVQWMLMLTFIVYLATHTTQIKEKSHTNTYILTELQIKSEAEHSKAILIDKNIGNMDVKNGSVVIPVDGQYLLYFEGEVEDVRSSNMTVTVWAKQPHENSDMALFSEQIRNGAVRAMALKDLKYYSEIYVEKSLIFPNFNRFNLNIFLLESNSHF